MEQSSDLLATLLDMRNGQVAADCNRKWSELVKAVGETGGKGSLTIKLNIKPSKMAMGSRVVEVEIDHETKMSRPEPEIGKSTFFLTTEGGLSRDDPNQVGMFGDATRREVSDERTR